MKNLIQQLRIGNYIAIISETDEILRVGGIKLFDNDSDDDSVRLETIDSWIAISGVCEVPITEKWLQNFGFEETVDDYGERWIKKGGNPHNFTFDIGDYPEDNPNCGYMGLYVEPGHWVGIAWNIKYVHQLQNLYYALTGKEL